MYSFANIHVTCLTKHLFSPLYANGTFARAIAIMGGCSFMKRALDALRRIVCRSRPWEGCRPVDSRMTVIFWRGIIIDTSFTCISIVLYLCDSVTIIEISCANFFKSLFQYHFLKNVVEKYGRKIFLYLLHLTLSHIFLQLRTLHLSTLDYICVFVRKRLSVERDPRA